MFPGPTQLRLTGSLTEINLDPKIQIKYVDTKKTNLLTFWPREFHTWWMESSSLSVQHQQSQLLKLPTSDVEKDAGRERRRKNCGQTKTNDEFGIEKLCRVSNNAKFDCTYMPGESPSWQSRIRSDSWSGAARINNGETRCMWFGHWRRFGDIKRIQSLCRISFIHWKSENEIADDAESCSRRQKKTTSTNTLLFEVCSCLQQWTQPFSWQRLLRQSELHQKKWETHCEEIVRRVSKNDSRTRIVLLRSVTNQLENFSMNKTVPGERRRSNQSHEGKSLCILRVCIVSWKSSGIPWIKRWMGEKTTMVQELEGIQTIG